MKDIDPLVQELYTNVPQFDKMSDHADDELLYFVYGQLSLQLFDDITSNDTTTEFTKSCFNFFNLIGDRNRLH